MPSVLRSVAVFAFVSAIAVLSGPGCSQQSEGQRCDVVANGDADCDDGLVCVRQADLNNGSADICCHPDPANDSDSRCVRSAPGGNSGGTSSTDAGASPGGAATGGAAGEAAGGTPGSGGAPGSAGTPGASGSPTMTDGGMSGAGGSPAPTDGGAAGAGTAGQGGAG